MWYRLVAVTGIACVLVSLGGCPAPIDDSAAVEVAAPTFSPNGGRFLTPLDVQIACGTPNATIYYTTDGTDPGPSNGQVYTAAVHLEAGATLKAVAMVDTYTSEIASATFIRQYLLAVAVEGAGTVTPEPGLYDAGEEVQLVATAGAGWRFDHWEGDLSGSTASTVAVVDRDLAAKACFVQTASNVAVVNALALGNGALYINPTGTPVGAGYSYPVGTTVRLSAVPASGWVFSGWYTEDGLFVNLSPEMDVLLAGDTNFIGLFETAAPPPLPVPSDCILLAGDGQILGVISRNKYDSDSLANPYGTYGNKYAMYSIWNRYGAYGSPYATYSAYNAYATNPPIIVENGLPIGYVTKNTWKIPRIDPDELAILLGRYDVLR